MSVGFVVKPFTNGLRYISSMPALSAPSANSFTFRSLIAVISPPWTLRHDSFCGLSERAHALERRRGLTLGVAVVDEKRGAARSLACFDVAPAIADHV